MVILKGEIMRAFKSLTGSYLLTLSVLITIQFFVARLGLFSEDTTAFIWSILTPFAFVGAVIIFIEALSTREKILPYLSAGLVALYAWNWIGFTKGTDSLILWAFLDTFFVLLAWACGLRLWQSER